ncbi:trimethylamine monooxygenase-like [Bolinopsis microptera]|uniref:trimethylamine monooxygenase-like n=1 Tax=Bolinopsis microptera TaxID=2820187 RepID=UPI0030791702
MVVRVCIVGAGPSGMSTLAMFKKLKDQGVECEVTCFEKQEQPGGLWNLTWRTGTDEFGEPVHCSQYRDLFSNGPKECLEFPDYTFDDHFGKPIPSYPPRDVLFDYLRGYWKFHGVKKEDVLTRHVVRNVSFDDKTATFTVRVRNLVQGLDIEQEFDRLIVASGHFSVPNVPHFEGIETFEGRAMHSHDLRNAREFTGKRILVVGSSYSAEDIALQLFKFGAEQITISYRTAKLGFKWPEKIHEVPLLIKIEGKTCHFKDGTSGDYDAIILCTGYRHHFPFLPSELSLPNGNVFNLPNLYRNVQWYGVTEGKKNASGLFYLGMTNQFYTYTMFMMQGLWAVSVIKGIIQTPEREDCVEDIEKRYAENANLTDCFKMIASQADYMKQLSTDLNYTEVLDCEELYYQWVQHKLDDIITYRDKCYKSLYTLKDSPVHPTPWVKCYDDSLEAFISA